MFNAATREPIIDLGSGLKIFGWLNPVVQRFWGRLGKQPQWRAFVGWETYYRVFLGTDAAHALIQHTGPVVGDATVQTELINAMAGGRAAAIVWAPPGCGKSRFALELARRMEKAPDRWQVLFVQHDDTGVREELHELAQLQRVVLIVDDAHDCPGLVKTLAAASASAPSSAPLHLICLTRSTGRAEVSRALQSSLPPGAVREIDLGRPSPGLVRALIDKLLPKSSPHHRDTIARFVRQSYFGAVLVCTLLSRQKTLPQTFQRQDLRDRVLREPLREAVGSACPIEAALRALAVYAALSPVPRGSVEVRELAAQLSALAPATVETVVDRLLAAGLFQEYGSGLVRPIPDLLGDLILEQACLDTQGKPTPYSNQLLERMFEAHPAETVRNCADIGQLFATAQDTDLVSGLVVTRARTISSESKREAVKLLQILEPLANRRPGTVLEVTGILEKRGILHRRPPAPELFGTDSIEMHSCALLMRAGEVDPAVIPAALQLGRDLYSAARSDERSSERVLTLLRSHCKFEMGPGLAHANAIVNELRAWVSDADPEAAILAALLSTQFLTLEVEVPQEEAGGIAQVTSSLNPEPDVWAVRNVAVDTVSRAISRAESTVQSATLGALYRYAAARVIPDAGWVEHWQPQLKRELDTLLVAIGKLPTATKSLPVWAAAERLGWHWWTQELNEPQRAGAAVLAATANTDAYQLWKLLHSQQLPLNSAPPADGQLTPQGRLEHFQGLAALREADTAGRARQLFDALDPHHPDSNSWRASWRSVFDQSPAMPLQEHAGAAIGEFARRHSDTAWSFITEAEADGPLFPMLPLLLIELGKQDRARRSKLAQNARPGTRLEEAWLRVLWSAHELVDAEQTLVARGLASSNQQTMHRAAEALLNASGASPREAFDGVFAAIAQHPADGVLWDLAIDHFVRWAESVLLPDTLEPNQLVGHVAGGLITVMQKYGSHLRWGFQPYTRQLPGAFAILAMVSPSRLQEWMQQIWGHAQQRGTGWNDESPLSVGRIAGAMGSIRNSPVAAKWIEVFVVWMRGRRPLASVAAQGLAILCALDHPKVTDFVAEIGRNPTEDSLQSVVDFIGQQRSKADFRQKSQVLLEMFARHPTSYARIEEAIVGAAKGGLPG